MLEAYNFEIYDILWIILPLAVGAGWWYAKRDTQKYQQFLYTLSLRYLLEDKGFEAEKNLADLSELGENDNADLFLILGALFRKRGEIDKAIAMHEHVINSEYIDDDLKLKARWALVDDYMVSGFLDRAEALLRELLDSVYHDEALLKLAKVYEKQRDWLQAIAALDRLPGNIKFSHRSEIAHFYCEIAEAEVNQHNAINWLMQALNSDENSIRAMLILINIAISHQDFAKAFELLKVIENKQAALAPLITPIFYYVCNVYKGSAEFEQFLERNLQNQHAHIDLILWKTHYLVLNEGKFAAYKFLEQQLLLSPNLKGILLLNQLAINIEEDNSALVYAKTFKQVIDHYSKFRCEECGFVTKILHWRCPSCNKWDTALPSKDIIALRNFKK